MRTILLLLLTCASLIACDSNKGVGIPVHVTLQPNVTQSQVWDFSDCRFGIRNDSFWVSCKNARNLEVRLFDLTTGVEYAGGVLNNGMVFYCINNCESMSGHVLVMNLTYTGRKPIEVEIQQSACWCN